MPAKKRKSSAKGAWPTEKPEELSKKLSNAYYSANPKRASANFGDSLESRMGPMFLGGGSDVYDGGLGYMGEYLGTPMYGGEESTIRGAHANSPLHKGGQRQGETSAAWSRMRLTSSVYENDGQVSSIVDLMADFATDGLGFSHSNDSVQKFYNAWMQKVKLRKKFRDVVANTIIHGNVFIYRVFAKIDEEDKKAMKSFTVGEVVGDKLIITTEDGDQLLVDPKIQYDSAIRLMIEAGASKTTDDSIKEDIKNFVVEKLKSSGAKIIDRTVNVGEENVIPWKHVCLNPTQIMPDPDSNGWIYLLTREEVKKLLSSVNISFNETESAIKVTLPNDMSGNIKKTNKSGFFAEMKIDENRLAVIQYGKYDWQKWGFGLVWKAMPTVTFKNTLRAMETKTAKAGINTLFLWKLGDHEKGLIPQMEDFERLADMLKAPASTLNVLWNSAIDCEVKQANIREIFDPSRWEGLRREVTAQFGITQSVITGEGGNFSSSFISVQGLLEKLQSIRDMLVEEWLLQEVMIIHKALGFRKLPRVRFGQMSLRDKNAENTFLVALYDRGIISDETLYETVEKDKEIERDRLVAERAWEDETGYERRGPFIKNPEQRMFDEKKLREDIKQKTMDSTEQQKNINGRPPGSKGPQVNKRATKPKNLASQDLGEQDND